MSERTRVPITSRIEMTNSPGGEVRPAPVRRQTLRAASQTEPQTVADPFPFLQNLTTEKLVEGIILSEVLGKPVSKRR